MLKNSLGLLGAASLMAILASQSANAQSAPRFMLDYVHAGVANLSGAGALGADIGANYDAVASRVQAAF